MRLTQMIEYLNADPKSFSYSEGFTLVNGHALTHFKITDESKKVRKKYRKNLI